MFQAILIHAKRILIAVALILLITLSFVLALGLMGAVGLLRLLGRESPELLDEMLDRIHRCR